jgi:hypothetical protein
MYSSVRAVYRITTNCEGPCSARQIVVDEFADRVPASALDRIKLLISELVTTRIVLGDPGLEERIVLDLRNDGIVRCAVVDHGPAILPQGLALGVFDQLSDRWGLTRSCDGTQMWFETEATAA